MTVNNVNALLNYAGGQTDISGMKQDMPAQDTFNQVMAKANDTINSLRTDLAGNAAGTSTAVQTVGTVDIAKKEMTVQSETSKAPSDSGKTEETAQQKDNAASTGETETDAKADQVTEEVEEAAKELVQDIAEEMDVTPEQVEEAMAVLGLTAVELFDTDNLKQLLLQITGSTDELSLVTDETLYGNLQNLLTAVEETLGSLQEELGLTEEELNTLVEQMIADSVETDEPMTEPVQDMPETGMEGMKDYSVSVQKDGETVQVKVTVDDASGSKSVREEVTAPKAEMQTGHRTRGRNASADSGRGEGGAAC